MNVNNKNKIIRQIVVCLIVMVMNTISQASTLTGNALYGIVDFGDPQAQEFKQYLNTLPQTDGSNRVITITQFGDSHSAADFFTGELRALLQKKYGDAGIGWVTPMSVTGQYHSSVTWKSKYWQLFSSRNTIGKDFPMGGYIAQPTQSSGYIQVFPKNVDINDIWTIKLVIKPLKSSSKVMVLDNANSRQQIAFTQKSKIDKWQTSSMKVTAPFTISSNKDAVQLGGIWLQKYQQSGAIVSMIGTNGAKQSIWQKWSSNWYQELALTNSNMVILEYGTNEAFDATLDLVEYRHNLVETIKKIRATLPHAVVLLMSPPDTMLATVKSDNIIERQPPNYMQIRQIQQDVAKQQKTLYWDWQTAMGGPGIINKWLLLDLARPDLVHLTKQGYIESARIFYRDLMTFAQ